MLVGASLRDLTNARAFDVTIVDANGDPIVDFVGTGSTPPSSAAITSVAGSATSVSLLAANASRKKFIIFNDSAKNLRVALGAGPASSTVFSFILPKGGVYESSVGDFTGAIQGIWESADGFARITELT